MTIPSADTEQKKEKRAVGVFPHLSLSKTLELVNKIYELGEGEPVRRLTVFHKLGKSPDSGASRVLAVANNSGYGLTNGSYAAEYLSLTDRGRQIASAQDPVSKYEGIYEALFSNEIFSAFVNRFNNKGVPIDEIAIEYLKTNHKLPQDDAEACWAVFKENLSDQNLIQEFSGKRIIVSRDAALEILGKSPEKKSDKTGKDGAADTGSMEGSVKQNNTVNDQKSSGQVNTIVPQVHFNIQVMIPENASPETYDLIFKSIATHLLNRDNG